MNIFKESLKSFIWNLAGAILLFSFQIFLAKYLGAYTYGQANYYLGFVATISIFMYFGIQFYFPRYMQLSKDNNKFFSETFFTITFLYLIVSPILIIFLKRDITLQYIIIILLLAYLMICMELVLSYYVAIGNTKVGMFYKRFILAILNIVFFVMIYFLNGKHVNTYLYSIILAYLVICVPILIYKVNIVKLNFHFIRLSYKFYIIQVLYGVYLSFSKVLQGKFGTFESVAILSIAITLGNATNMFGDSFAKVVMPDFSRAWEERNILRLSSTFKYASRMNAYLVMPIAIFTIINSNNILNILGKGYYGGGIILSLVLFSQFFSSFVGPNGTLLNMTNNERYEIVNGIIKLILSIVIVFLLSEKYYWGIALSIALPEVVINLLKTLQLKKIFNILPYNFADVKFLGVIFGVELITFYCFSNIKSIIVWTLFNGIAGLIFYFISFRFSNHAEDKEVINKIFNKLRVSNMLVR